LAGDDPEGLEGYVMAHREQHSNREAKKPKKEKPKGDAAAQPNRWAVSEALQARDNSKH
jgi:hypothetical protein